MLSNRIYLLAILFFVTLLVIVVCALTPVNRNSDVAESFYLAPGKSSRQVALDLQQQGLLNHPQLFNWFTRLSFNSRKLQAGYYTIEPDTSLWRLIHEFSTGAVSQAKLTIIEGWTSKDLVQAIISNEDIHKTLTQTELTAFLQSGMFLPETYHFPKGMTDVEVLSRARQHMEQQLQALWQTRASNLPYSHPEQALVVASLIEKETHIDSERAHISGVIHRRLTKKMPLQLDASVIYSLADNYQGKLTKSDLKTDSPYNTYKNKGLPPGPICLPGLKSIRAALHPAPGSALYFVASNQGHVFSATLAEHNKAVAKYRLN